MTSKWILIAGLSAAALPAPALADCSLKYDACTAWCEVRYIDSRSGAIGCKTRCGADRAACLAEKGVDKAKALGEAGAEKAKGFWEGLKHE